MRIAIFLFCVSAIAQHPMMPDPKLTPGTTDPRVTQATVATTICKDGYTKTVRNVSEAVKKQVMARYGLPLTDLKLVEIDHFISLEAGGLNDISNMWPQYYDAAPGQSGYLGAREKDVVEDYLHRQIYAAKVDMSGPVFRAVGGMTLAQAQTALWTWPELYANIKIGK